MTLDRAPPPSLPPQTLLGLAASLTPHSRGLSHPAVHPQHPESGSPQFERPHENWGRDRGGCELQLLRAGGHSCTPGGRCLTCFSRQLSVAGMRTQGTVAKWMRTWGCKRSATRQRRASRGRGGEAREQPWAELGGAQGPATLISLTPRRPPSAVLSFPHPYQTVVPHAHLLACHINAHPAL